MNLQTAYRFAADKHGDQMYGEHPYVYHLVQVHLSVNRACLDETHQIVAVLHDVLEDTSTSAEELATKFGATVAEAVAAMTRVKGEDYLQKLLRNPIARAVKTHDAMCNMQASIDAQDMRRVRKYAQLLVALTNV